jgi:hypothetical protein
MLYLISIHNMKIELSLYDSFLKELLKKMVHKKFINDIIS